MSTVDKDSEDIEPGAVNHARTKCRCQCCEKVMDLDPSWTADQECPLCEESLFAWSCMGCYHACSSHSQCDEPPFPDFPCDACGETKEYQEKQEKEYEELQNEAKRIQRGAEYRKLKENHQHQGRINHTRTSLYTNDPKDASHPKDVADAIRIHQGTWEKIRPLVLQELGLQGHKNDDESVLTPQWGQRVVTFFERSWLEENAEALQSGVEQNSTGCLYIFNCHLKCNLRSLREGFSECLAVYPTVPKVSIDEEAWQALWDPDVPPDQDPREIYKTDRDKTLTFYEFILWCIRLGFAMDGDFNPKYFVKETDKRTTEPIAYVPLDWVGRPRLWEKEREYDFQRFHWMDPPVYKWKGTRIRDDQLEEMSREHMERCCVCYGSPPEGHDLMVCECMERLYCSQTCKDKYMQVHKYDPTLRHPQEVKMCCNCGEQQPGLKRCGKCKYAYFCDEYCQKSAWSLHHKAQCF